MSGTLGRGWGGHFGYGLDVGRLLFRMDSDDGLPMTVAESGAMSKFIRPDAGPVVMLNMLVDVLGDD